MHHTGIPGILAAALSAAGLPSHLPSRAYRRRIWPARCAASSRRLTGTTPARSGECVLQGSGPLAYPTSADLCSLHCVPVPRREGGGVQHAFKHPHAYMRVTSYRPPQGRGFCQGHDGHCGIVGRPALWPAHGGDPQFHQVRLAKCSAQCVMVCRSICLPDLLCRVFTRCAWHTVWAFPAPALIICPAEESTPPQPQPRRHHHQRLRSLPSPPPPHHLRAQTRWPLRLRLRLMRLQRSLAPRCGGGGGVAPVAQTLCVRASHNNSLPGLVRPMGRGVLAALATSCVRARFCTMLYAAFQLAAVGSHGWLHCGGTGARTPIPSILPRRRWGRA